MSAPDFVHLHVHSEYSLLDGANRIGDLVKACKADGQRAVALTDHGNMYGAVELYQKASASDVKPILGCEVYIAKRSMREKHSKRDGNGYSHLTLLARTQEGYKNLVKLTSAAFVDGYHFKPRIDLALLEKHAAGISCLSGCLASEINQLTRVGKEREAEDLAVKLRDLFGPAHFWLELQRNGIQIQADANEALVRMHQRTGIPLVATNDIHYLRAEDCHAQDVLLCINTGAKKADKDRFKFDSNTLFFATRAEMGHMFRDLPEALSATMDVAGQIDVKLQFGKYHVPEFKTDSGEPADQLFDRLLDERRSALYGAEHAASIERLQHEKKVIRQLGFVSYFLIVWDLIKWARDNGIPVGPGRGSAAGSIVSYLLDITRLDPLKYDLLFERFLNSSRVSMPDIDIDFCKDGRERVIEYTRRRYGSECVTQIVTFGTMASRTVVRDVGRALDLPLREIDKIAKKIPAGPNAPSLAEALETDTDLQAFRDQGPEWAELFRYSTALEGMARHVSTHAAGVVITPGPTVEFVPLGRNGDDITTQYPAPQLEELGLLKMDYLGLRTLTIIDKTLKNIVRLGGTPPDIDNLPLDDKKVFELLMAGDTLGVFQLESEGMRKLLARLRPDCFDDVVAVLALYRPGPLESGMVDMFCNRKHKLEPIVYPHGTLAGILGNTYGCLVYQEQVMLASVALGGFSLNDADNLRKAMGKKKPEIMQKFSAQFLDGAEKNGCARQAAQEIWDNIIKFGGYGFNKSHSAAYALITYQTAYLKAHHRTAFLAANFSCEMGDSDKVKDFLDDCRRARIEILPPSAWESMWEFTPIERDGRRAIRFGFGAVKGTGQKAIEALERSRTKLAGEGSTRPGFHELITAVDPQEMGKVAWEAVIKAGAFDEAGHNRGAVLAALEKAMRDAAVAAADRRSGQASMFDAFGGGAPAESKGGSGIDPRHAIGKAEVLKLEYEALGYYLSGHPLEERAGLVALLSSSPIAKLRECPGGTEVRLAGLVLQKAELLVKSGKMAGSKMCRFRLEDLSGSIGVTCFPRTYEETKHMIEDGAVLLVRGKLEEGTDEPALLLDELWNLTEALAQFRGGLQVQVGPEDKDRLARLLEACDRHRGPSPLFLQARGHDGLTRRIRAGKERGVKISEELAKELVELLGRDRVGLVRV